MRASAGVWEQWRWEGAWASSAETRRRGRQKSSSKGQGVARNLWIQPDAAVQREHARFEVVTTAQPRRIWRSPSGA